VYADVNPSVRGASGSGCDGRTAGSTLVAGAWCIRAGGRRRGL